MRDLQELLEEQFGTIPTEWLLRRDPYLVSGQFFGCGDWLIDQVRRHPIGHLAGCDWAKGRLQSKWLWQNDRHTAFVHFADHKCPGLCRHHKRPCLGHKSLFVIHGYPLSYRIIFYTDSGGQPMIISVRRKYSEL